MSLLSLAAMGLCWLFMEACKKKLKRTGGQNINDLLFLKNWFLEHVKTFDMKYSTKRK